MARQRYCFFLAVWAVAGCAGVPEPVEESRQLPFVVRVREPRVSATPRGADVATPVPASAGRSLSPRIAAVLDELELFTLTVTENQKRVEADLDLEVALVGRDFGPGHASLRGGVFSSLTWLFAGHASWWIPDRSYPESDVALVVSLRRPERASRSDYTTQRASLFEDVLQLNDLELSYSERAGATYSLLNIVVPPTLIEGDKEKIGAELVRAAVERFGRQEPEQLLARLPASDFAAERTFVLYEPSSHVLLLAADEAVVELSIIAASEGGAERRDLDADAVAACGITAGEGFEDARLTFSTRAPGVNASRYYSVPLDSDERGFVRVRAVLNNGETAGTWTLRITG